LPKGEIAYMNDRAAESPSHERVLAALELREPDRVPTFDLMLEPAIVGDMLGKRPSLTDRAFSEPRLAGFFDWYLGNLARFPGAYEMLIGGIISDYNRKFALEAARVAVEMGYDSAWLAFSAIMRNRDARSMTDIHGRLLDVAVSETGFQEPPVYREGLIKSEADWKAWNKRPLLALPQKANSAFREVVSEYGSKLFIFGFVTYGIFENIWQPMGFERFIVATRKEKRLVARMIRFYEDLHCMLIEALADAGVPAVVYTDDLAYKSGPMLSPKMMKGLFEDSYRRLVETAHALGIKLVMHSCGNVTSLLEFFADCGFDAVQSLEPTAGVKIKEAKALVGDRMCLIGNIDVSEVLVSGSREEVFDAVRKAIEDAGLGGGFILSPAHNHSGVSVERLRWMLEASREYGSYQKA
jgi:uroporphyrinogen decarboxylase